MAVWINNAGENKEFEEIFLKNNIIAIDWMKIKKDLSNISYEELIYIYKEAYNIKNELNKVEKDDISEIWRFLNEMKKGDIVLIPLSGGKVLVAEINGEYTFNKERPRHRRKVKRIGTISRAQYKEYFNKQLQYGRTVAKLKDENNNYLKEEDILKLTNTKFEDF
jgi:predicted Mrr-cat superfamily restriction endonuclease